MQQYTITNEYFTSESEDSENAEYKPAPLPAGMVKSFSTGSDVPWFSIFSPNIVKNIPLGPGLGISVFSEALDQAKHCDLAFDNYCRDIYLGEKVFYNKNLLKSIIDGDGNVLFAAGRYTQQLFVHAGSTRGRTGLARIQPDLRTEANSQAVGRFGLFQLQGRPWDTTTSSTPEYRHRNTVYRRPAGYGAACKPASDKNRGGVTADPAGHAVGRKGAYRRSDR
ncbi:MAG: hypothetical protein ACLR7U_11660 [Ruthenibacterium lactatiformans]